MLEFNDPEDAFKITDRGVCYSSSRWKLPEGMWEPWDLAGETVLLCGKEVIVRGVEAFCIPRSPSSPYPYSFAILIDFETAEGMPVDYRSYRTPKQQNR